MPAVLNSAFLFSVANRTVASPYADALKKPPPRKPAPILPAQPVSMERCATSGICNTACFTPAGCDGNIKPRLRPNIWEKVKIFLKSKKEPKKLPGQAAKEYQQRVMDDPVKAAARRENQKVYMERHLSKKTPGELEERRVKLLANRKEKR